MMDVRRMSAAAILVLACSAVAAAQAKGGGADSKTGLVAEKSASLEATARALDATATPGASEADPNDKPFARLFPNLWTDLRLLVSTKDNAITWAIATPSGPKNTPVSRPRRPCVIDPRRPNR